MAWHLWRDAKTPLVTEDSPPRAALGPVGLPPRPCHPACEPQARRAVLGHLLGTVPQGTPLWVYLALLALIFTAETVWNSLVARIFSLDRTRARYISLKTVIDRSFGGLLALLGVKIAAT